MDRKVFESTNEYLEQQYPISFKTPWQKQRPERDVISVNFLFVLHAYTWYWILMLIKERVDKAKFLYKKGQWYLSMYIYFIYICCAEILKNFTDVKHVLIFSLVHYTSDRQ